MQTALTQLKIFLTLLSLGKNKFWGARLGNYNI